MDTHRTPRLVVAATILVAVVTTVAAGPQARPRAFDPELLRTGDIIRYRALSRKDFLAVAPPAEAAGLHGRLGAATCVFLTTDPETAIRASAPRTDDRQRSLVHAQVENLGFIAIMDRECSWWNPAPMQLPDDYILQHEQIHFALFEIAARRLNGRVVELTSEMQTVASSQQSAIEQISARIDREMQREIDVVLARSNDFDRETSRTFRQDRQNWWWQTVRRELDRLSMVDGTEGRP